jgi:ribosomal protein S18 acetylase RimI-like enzyme
MPHSIVLLRDPAEMAGALSLLVSGFPPAEQPGYLDTLARLVSRPTAAEELVVAEARQANQRVGIALAQLLAGRAALVWPVRSVAQEVAGNLLDRALDELRLRGVVVAQALATPDEPQETQLFHSAGFADGGELLYMAATEDAFLSQPPASDVAFDVVSPDDAELARVVAETYQGSLDCPLVDGWRTIEDVLAGYLGTGTHRAELWRLLRRRGEAVGCLLLSDFPEYQQGELTYLGICPQYRGQGLGLIATRWTLHFAQQTNWQQVLLAVDAQNEPARRVYCDAGFHEVTTRRLLARRL